MYTADEIQQAARAFRMERGVETSMLPVKRLTEGAALPEYGSNGAAGLDLRLDLSHPAHGEDTPMEERATTVYPGFRALLKTGIAVAVPRGHYGRVAPRSGLALKSGIEVMAGVIDEDYRGEIGVILHNLGDKPHNFHHGDKIAQLIVEKYTPSLPVEYSELPETVRGAGGWGSTGK